MQRRIVGFIAFLTILMACGKDTFQTKPTFTIESVSSNDIVPGQPLIVKLKYTDKEGDLGGGRIGVQKVVPQCALSNFTDTNKYVISDEVPATKNQQGEIEINFPYVFINPFCNFNDTATFRFWVKDKAGNISDTATTGTIVIRKS